jgi:hypothetical protein
MKLGATTCVALKSYMFSEYFAHEGPETLERRHGLDGGSANLQTSVPMKC